MCYHLAFLGPALIDNWPHVLPPSVPFVVDPIIFVFKLRSALLAFVSPSAFRVFFRAFLRPVSVFFLWSDHWLRATQPSEVQVQDLAFVHRSVHSCSFCLLLSRHTSFGFYFRHLRAPVRSPLAVDIYRSLFFSYYAFVSRMRRRASIRDVGYIHSFIYFFSNSRIFDSPFRFLG